jgi:type VI secretion system protein ImpA
VSEASACGVDVRTDAQAQALYYELKDARNSARAAERSVSADEPIGVVPLWNEVNSLALRILTEYSKDIEILCWLAEAQLRLRGFAGLRDTLAVLASLVENYWPDLHSVANDTVEDRVAPLTGLNGQGGEGVLIQALRLTPLIPDNGYGKFGLWDYQRAQRAGETALRDVLYQAVAEKGTAAMRIHLAEVESCLDHFNSLNRKLDELCGQDAPPASNIRQVMQEAALAIKAMAHIESAEGDAPPAAQQAAEEPDTPAISAPGANGSIRSREEAFEILLKVAQFFRRTEPHSPTAQTLETLVRRGRMDFQELLGELLPDAAIRASVLTAAGIQPKVDRSDG